MIDSHTYKHTIPATYVVGRLYLASNFCRDLASLTTFPHSTSLLSFHFVFYLSRVQTMCHFFACEVEAATPSEIFQALCSGTLILASCLLSDSILSTRKVLYGYHEIKASISLFYIRYLYAPFSLDVSHFIQPSTCLINRGVFAEEPAIPCCFISRELAIVVSHSHSAQVSRLPQSLTRYHRLRTFQAERRTWLSPRLASGVCLTRVIVVSGECLQTTGRLSGG